MFQSNSSLVTDVTHAGDKKASSTKSTKGTNRVKPHGSHALTRIVIDSFTPAPNLRLGEKSSTRQTFEVFTGAAPGCSSTSAIHGSRKTWKV
jgi:hypothetical protein